MKHEIPENPYEVWVARRRQDFTGVDLSYLVAASVRSIDLCGEITVPLLMHCAPAGLAPVYLPADTVRLLRAICDEAGIDADSYADDILGTHTREVLTDDMNEARYGCHIINDIAGAYEIRDEDGSVLDEGEVAHLLWDAVDTFKAETSAEERGAA
jgi:hypothetical protein